MADNKIVLENEEFLIDEDGEVDGASGGVTPGALVAYYGNADYDVHATAGGTSPAPRFARKKGEIGGTITDDHAAGDHIKVAYCGSGVKVNGLLAAGENVGAGELLASGGDGTLVSAEDGTSPYGEDAAVARATVANDNSAGSSAVRLVVEVL